MPHSSVINIQKYSGIKKEDLNKIIRKGDVNAIQEYLKTITDPETNKAYVHLIDAPMDKKSNTMLLLAVFYDQDEITKQLLASGANVNKGNKKQTTPMQIAATKGNTEILTQLIEAKADVNEWDEHRRRPIQFAVENSKTEAVRILVAAGAKVQIWTRLYSFPFGYEPHDLLGRVLDLASKNKIDMDVVRMIFLKGKIDKGTLNRYYLKLQKKGKNDLADIVSERLIKIETAAIKDQKEKEELRQAKKLEEERKEELRRVKKLEEEKISKAQQDMADLIDFSGDDPEVNKSNDNRSLEDRINHLEIENKNIKEQMGQLQNFNETFLKEMRTAIHHARRASRSIKFFKGSEKDDKHSIESKLVKTSTTRKSHP